MRGTLLWWQNGKGQGWGSTCFPFISKASFSCGKDTWSIENAYYLIPQSIRSAHYSQFACFLANIHQSLVPCRTLSHVTPCLLLIYKKANNQRQATCTDHVLTSKISEKERKRNIMSGSDLISSLLNSHVLVQTAKSQWHKDSSHTWQRTEVSQLTFNPRKM